MSVPFFSRLSLSTPRRLSVLVFWIALMAALSGCQSTPTKPGQESSAGATLQDAETLLVQATKLEGDIKVQKMLRASELFVALGQPERAVETLNTLTSSTADTSKLDDALYAKVLTVQSRGLFRSGDILGAKSNLESARLVRALPLLRADIAAELYALRASVYYELGEFIQSADDRILVASKLDELESQPFLMATSENLPDKQINQELIWMTLMEQDISALQTASERATLSPIGVGWYTLAILNKNNQHNINRQFEALKTWQMQWPLHPANNPLPADLELIADIVNNQPTQIALLLPLDGALAQVSKAIRDGFMAAYFNNQLTGTSTPDIKIYDISRGNFNEHYDFAAAQGAQVIIGPLTKENVSELALRPELPVPTLALNRLEDSEFAPAELFQFGLAIEDEASQSAERGYLEGHRTALMLLPPDSNGDRAAKAFSEKFQELGGAVIRDVRYGSDSELSKAISQALGIDSSDARAREIKNIVGKIAFIPRRRQDIDMIFMVAKPRQGRQIKPLLAYHYAGDIPVYSTSHLYDDTQNQRERDLNGIYLSHLPWFFQDSVDKTTVQSIDNASAMLQSLYALGIDAYYLYPRLTQLNVARSANFWGQTGTLTLNDKRQFVRKQQWAKFSRGELVPIAMSYDDDMTTDIDFENAPPPMELDDAADHSDW